MVRIASILWLLVVAVGSAWANPVPPPDNYFYDLLIDTDNNPGTGCSTPAVDDNTNTTLTGIERIVRAKVERPTVNTMVYSGLSACGITNPRVIELERLDCDAGSGMFSHTVFDLGDWNVGINNGVIGADVVEAYVRVADLGPTRYPIRLFFRATGPTPNSDVLLTLNGQGNGGPILLGTTASAPAASATALLIIAACLLGGGMWSVRRRAGHGSRAVVAVAMLLAGALTAWAATITMDGAVTDWAGSAPSATDVIGDSSSNDDAEDIVAAFVTSDGQKFYFRVDVVNLESPC